MTMVLAVRLMYEAHLLMSLAGVQFIMKRAYLAGEDMESGSERQLVRDRPAATDRAKEIHGVIVLETLQDASRQGKNKC